MVLSIELCMLLLSSACVTFVSVWCRDQESPRLETVMKYYI